VSSSQYYLKMRHLPKRRTISLSFYIYDEDERQMWRDIRGALEGDMNFDDVRVVVVRESETEVEL
jgi:hypothetical protein